MVTIKLRHGSIGRLLVFLDKLHRNVPIELRDTLRGAARGVMREMRNIIKTEKKYSNKLNPGRLERDMEIVATGNGYNINVYAPYAGLVDRGAKPHMIYPVHAKMLRYEASDGTIRFARMVNHPGIQQPMFFARRATDRIANKMSGLVDKGVNKAIRRSIK